jgi:hypothetical protein
LSLLSWKRKMSTTMFLLSFRYDIYLCLWYIQSLVLENLSHPFLKPNILDIKLGTVLYDEEATEEKKERMKTSARNTTSGETGIRLTGFQVGLLVQFFAFDFGCWMGLMVCSFLLCLLCCGWL